MSDNPPFCWQYLDDEINVPDVIKSAQEGELIGIVSEAAGGIIAYAIGPKNAQEIVDALEDKANIEGRQYYENTVENLDTSEGV